MITETLKKLNLTEKEIKLYLGLLELGEQSAGALATVLGMPRSTAQFLANSLVNKGIVNKGTSSSGSVYYPKAARSLSLILDEKKESIEAQIDETKTDLQRIMPFLENLENKFSETRPLGFSSVHYHGFNNVIKSFYDFYDRAKTGDTVLIYRNISSQEMFFLKTAARKVTKHRVDKGVFCQMICSNNSQAINTKLADKSEIRETRIGYNISPARNLSQILILGDQVLSTSFDVCGPNFSCLLKHAHIAEFQKQIFQTLWDASA